MGEIFKTRQHKGEETEITLVIDPEFDSLLKEYDFCRFFEKDGLDFVLLQERSTLHHHICQVFSEINLASDCSTKISFSDPID